MTLRVDIEGIGETRQRLRSLRSRMLDITPISTDLADTYQQDRLDFIDFRASAEFDYRTEPIYRAIKRRAIGSTPMFRWPGSDDSIYEAIQNPDIQGYRNQTRLSFSGPIDSILRGGIGPYGEPYPGRDIFAIRSNLPDRLAELVDDHIGGSV
jgi:hypothetical protein